MKFLASINQASSIVSMSGHDETLDRQTVASGLPVVVRMVDSGDPDDLDAPNSRTGRIQELMLFRSRFLLHASASNNEPPKKD